MSRQIYKARITGCMILHQQLNVVIETSVSCVPDTGHDFHTTA